MLKKHKQSKSTFHKNGRSAAFVRISSAGSCVIHKLNAINAQQAIRLGFAVGIFAVAKPTLYLKGVNLAFALRSSLGKNTYHRALRDA